jgi:hypothetical protein
MAFCMRGSNQPFLCKRRRWIQPETPWNMLKTKLTGSSQYQQMIQSVKESPLTRHACRNGRGIHLILKRLGMFKPVPEPDSKDRRQRGTESRRNPTSDEDIADPHNPGLPRCGDQTYEQTASLRLKHSNKDDATTVVAGNGLRPSF